MSTAEAEVFVPYSRRAPQTDDIQALRAEHRLQIELHGRRSSEAAESFEHLLRASCAKGHPLDALNTHSRNEVERFFAQTVAGSDGHVYWNGAKHGFTRNDGHSRTPRRWWWAHRAGAEPPRELDVVATCGELHCINPEHCETGRDLRRRRFSEDQMLGALNVLALRLGHTPSTKDWDREAMRPSAAVFKMRYGSWANAVSTAGLPPVDPSLTRYVFPKKDIQPEQCIEALRVAAAVLGHVPSSETMRRQDVRDRLKEGGLPATPETIAKYLGDGSWRVALRRAGFTPSPGRATDAPAFVDGDGVKALRLVGELVGARPTNTHIRDPLVRKALEDARLPMTYESIANWGGGSWKAALAAAGYGPDA
jgi:hypothetical protein